MKLKWMICILFFSRVMHVWAQEEVLPIHRRGYMQAGIKIQYWQQERVPYTSNQIVMPFSALLLLSENISMSISHNPAYSWKNVDEGFFGFSDTWIQINSILWQERLMLNFGLGLPTGKTRLDSTQFAITKELSQSIYRYHVPLYGQGLTGRLGFAMAFKVAAPLIVGFGGQFLYRAPFHPVQYIYGQSVGLEKIYDKQFNPGEELSANAGLDLKLGEEMKLMLDIIYTHYWTDYLDNQVVFGAGDRISVNLGYFYRFANQYVWAYLAYRQRDKNSVLQGVSFMEEEISTGTYQLDFDIAWRAMRMRGGEILFYGEARYYGPETGDDGPTHIYGGGLGVIYDIMERLKLEGQIRGFGGVSQSVGERVVLGIYSYLGLKYEF
ncbi:MAG TPA: hypothetical protein ENN03_11840 [bacterium]|nr:hypothetical protein [bacterium]